MKRKTGPIAGLLLSAVLIASILLLNSCTPTAVIKCENPENFRVQFGYLNDPNVDFGYMFKLDTAHKVVNWFDVLKVVEADLSQAPPKNNTSIDIGKAFSVSITGSGAAKAKSAGVDLELKKEMKYKIINGFGRSILSPIAVLNNGANAAQLTDVKASAGEIIAVVTQLLMADSGKVYLEDKKVFNGFGEQTNVLSIKINVSYSCTGRYDKSGNGVAIFFNVQFFKADAAVGLVSLPTANIDLSKYFGESNQKIGTMLIRANLRKIQMRTN